MELKIPKSITQKNGKIYLSIHAKPGSRKEGITVIDDDSIEIAIHAQAQNNKANTALIEYIADIFDVSKNVVTFETGGTSRDKLISIQKDFTLPQVLEKLNENLI